MQYDHPIRGNMVGRSLQRGEIGPNDLIEIINYILACIGRCSFCKRVRSVYYVDEDAVTVHNYMLTGLYLRILCPA